MKKLTVFMMLVGILASAGCAATTANTVKVRVKTTGVVVARDCDDVLGETATAAGDDVLPHLARALVQGRRPCLADRHVDAPGLCAVHLLLEHALRKPLEVRPPPKTVED